MSVLEAVVDWARYELPDWQGDAVRRLLTQDGLTEGDKDELLLMLKGRHELVDSGISAPEPRAPEKGLVSGAPGVAEHLILKAMKGLRNVNAIPDDSELLFGHEGLTVIYGENAAGKTGYARVLKRACSARDRKERILPDVYCAGPHAPASARFKLCLEGGSDQEVSWTDGHDSPEVLSNIVVFDRKCARMIVDENNKVTYLPYGAFVFADLVTVLRELQEKLQAEKPRVQPLEYEDIPLQTQAGQLICKVNLAGVATGVEEFAKWSGEDERELAAIENQLAKAKAEDPLKQASAISRRERRIVALKEKVDELDQLLSDRHVDKILATANRVKGAQEAVRIFGEEAVHKFPLPGVGSETWRRLYLGAKEYSLRRAYEGEEFPYLGESSRCVLCMQELSRDSKVRFSEFRKFMEGTLQKTLDGEEASLNDLVEKIRGDQLQILGSCKDAMADVREMDGQLGEDVETYAQVMAQRARDILLVATDLEVREVSPRGVSPGKRIKELAERLNADAIQLGQLADPKRLQELQAQAAELGARKLLTERKSKILAHCERVARLQKYEGCITETIHKGITQRGRGIISAAVTEELETRFKDELRCVGAEHLDLSLRSSGLYGETSHKMELAKAPSLKGTKLTDLLSEGEQGIVALAGFLAELGVSGQISPIVLDDPISSLDHLYREKVAERLAREASTRQVIIFTHDIAFLLDLETKAGEHGVYFNPQTVMRIGPKSGMNMASLPWHAMSWKGRKQRLEALWKKTEPLHRTDPQKYNEKAAEIYNLLRETWECLVEEEILQKVVRRHCREVQTLRLKSVDFTTDDYKSMQIAMGKCSTWMVGHSASRALDDNRPAPNELMTDIKQLDVFVSSIKQRRKGLGEKRETSLKPASADVG